jgi:hypothetical protein
MAFRDNICWMISVSISYLCIFTCLIIVFITITWIVLNSKADRNKTERNWSWNEVLSFKFANVFLYQCETKSEHFVICRSILFVSSYKWFQSVLPFCQLKCQNHSRLDLRIADNFAATCISEMKQAFTILSSIKTWYFW